MTFDEIVDDFYEFFLFVFFFKKTTTLIQIRCSIRIRAKLNSFNFFSFVLNFSSFFILNLNKNVAKMQ